MDVTHTENIPSAATTKPLLIVQDFCDHETFLIHRFRWWYNDGMSTEMPHDEIHSFYEFLGRRIETGGKNLSPEQSVKEYRAYQDELKLFRQRIQTSMEQADRGEAKPLDHDALMQRVRARLAREGITD